MKCAYSHSGSCLQSRVSLVLGVLGKRRSRTEALDAVCACGLLIRITYLLCYASLGFYLFILFYFQTGVKILTEEQRKHSYLLE